MTPLQDVFGGLVLIGVAAALLSLLGYAASWVAVQLSRRLQVPACPALALGFVAATSALIWSASHVGRLFRPILWGLG